MYMFKLFRAFVAWEDNACRVVDPREEHNYRSTLEDYREKLRGPVVLPDPYTLDAGWIDENDGKPFWPTVNAYDISQLLQMTSPVDLCNRLMNEYKQGKAYR